MWLDKSELRGEESGVRNVRLDPHHAGLSRPQERVRILFLFQQETFKEVKLSDFITLAIYGKWKEGDQVILKQFRGVMVPGPRMRPWRTAVGRLHIYFRGRICGSC